ncbi:MAG: di-trans,poly-cis-decaprenylcistransferase [Sterolibacterium sp.]|nr:di-trans,poly-cis-decaprenylcistransferase [Sterolibacterium sp.]
MSTFLSSTRTIPATDGLPRHVAIIMDGNGRWAKKRFLPRAAGHKRGVEAVRDAVKACIERGIDYLTLFAFSSENWRRPQEEVSLLMNLFLHALENEVSRLHEAGVRLRIVGDLARFDDKLVSLIRAAEQRTAGNQRLTLTIAANYGGRWDIMQALNTLLVEQPEKRGGYDEADLSPYLSMAYAPEPDLFIRTGGEQRVSNFLLWQLAYTEFYFTDLLWPDFNAAALDEAIRSYQGRERRFGRTSEQLQATPSLDAQTADGVALGKVRRVSG